MNDIFSTLSVLNLVLTITGILGGLLAFRNGITRTANEVQERVIHALEIELESLRQRLDDMKDENIRLKHTIDTIYAALKGRGIVVTIEGDMISIRDDRGSTTSRIVDDGKQ